MGFGCTADVEQHGYRSHWTDLGGTAIDQILMNGKLLMEARKESEMDRSPTEDNIQEGE